jgi:hypothetical protein
MPLGSGIVVVVLNPVDDNAASSMKEDASKDVRTDDVTAFVVVVTLVCAVGLQGEPSTGLDRHQGAANLCAVRTNSRHSASPQSEHHFRREES